ncbi:hypothetical protein NBRC116588_12230 [Pyruvatibacter sp. HU-CL02332]
MSLAGFLAGTHRQGQPQKCRAGPPHGPYGRKGKDGMAGAPPKGSMSVSEAFNAHKRVRLPDGSAPARMVFGADRLHR